MAEISSAPRPAVDHVRAQLLGGRRLTAAEIGVAADLPRSTVVHALRRLAEAGEVQEHAAGPQPRGRPSRRWSTAAPPGPVLVVVAAAHGLTAGVVTLDGVVRSVLHQEPLEETADGRSGAGALHAADAVLEQAGTTAQDLSVAVVGLPGPSVLGRAPGQGDVVPSGHLRRFRTWDGTSPTAVLGRHLDCAVHAENDVKLAALGEATSGAAAGLATVLHVGLAHGTGAGLVLDGRLHQGRSGLAGEIGHLHSDDGGRLCHCGGRGCFWHVHSVPALLDALAEAHGRPFSAADVAAAAEEDEPDVVRALLGFGEALGRRLADAVVFVDPDAVVLDGSLGAASTVIADGVRNAISRYAPPAMARGTAVLVGAHGRDAALLGAVALVVQEGLLPVPV